MEPSRTALHMVDKICHFFNSAVARDHEASRTPGEGEAEQLKKGVERMKKMAK